MKRDAAESNAVMDSLLKIVASGRLLARLMEADDRWILKGGLNMLAHLGPTARLTRDADVATAIDREAAADAIAAAADQDLGDHFHFRVRPPVPVPADGERGGLRFRVEAIIGGKRLTSFDLDVVLTAPDAGDIERIALPNLLAFAGVAAPDVLALRPSRQTVEKLHAYTRDYGTQENSRPRDLVDMLALGAVLRFDAEELRGIGERVFATRGRHAWPPRLLPPPTYWVAYWDHNGRSKHGLPDVDLEGAFDLLQTFWRPVLDGEAGHWSPLDRKWELL